MNYQLQYWQPVERYERSDRRVRHAGMTLPAGASEHRATFLIEEALRLMALPGEDQGRTYYFRRVALRGIASGAPLGEWIDRTQATMHTLALRALHGTDTRAASADAVFFNSQQEALEWLLGRLLRAPGNTTMEWFAPMISNSPAASGPVVRVVAIVERLRGLPAGWFAAATALLNAIEADSDVLSLLASIPGQTVQLWLRELGATHAAQDHVTHLSARRRRILIERVASHHSSAGSSVQPEDVDQMAIGNAARPALFNSASRELPSYLVWLAALAIIAEDPGELARGFAVAKARGVLRQLAQSLNQSRPHETRDAHSLLKRYKTERSSATDSLHPRSSDSLDGVIQIDRECRTDVPNMSLDSTFDHSLPTAAGGLYFLLNVLGHLGIADAVDRLPSPLRKTFPARLIASLARAASVSQDDPALLWVAAQLDEASHAETSAFKIDPAPCWPRTFLHPPDSQLDIDRLVRVWSLAVRRWCWLAGRLTLREIVSRPGHILLNRTDLDVTLSMDTLDLRLRRLGLDLDPGWLPWLGLVVRFHYTSAPSQRSAHHLAGGAGV